MNVFLLKNEIEAIRKNLLLTFFFQLKFFNFSIKFLNIECLDQS